jgi:hypothetical protein
MSLFFFAAGGGEGVYRRAGTPHIPPRGLQGPLEPPLNLSAMNVKSLYSSGVMIRIKIIYE